MLARGERGTAGVASLARSDVLAGPCRLTFRAMDAAAFARDGFLQQSDVCSAAECDELAAHVEPQLDRAGTRQLLGETWCATLAAQLKERCVGLIPQTHRPVQCTLFDKSPVRNWLVAMHQDLSLPVATRVSGLSGWSEKEGQCFVHAPRALLEDIVAVRLHLDDCGAEDGPLRVVPGSHRSGVLDDTAARALRDAAGETGCYLPRGGVLLMRPLLLHASSKATSARRRRVLHFVYGPAEPGYGLHWPA